MLYLDKFKFKNKQLRFVEEVDDYFFVIKDLCILAGAHSYLSILSRLKPENKQCVRLMVNSTPKNVNFILSSDLHILADIIGTPKAARVLSQLEELVKSWR
jgi:prophage antirepressor-like protein